MDIFASFFQSLNLNWLDILIVIILLFYAMEGFALGILASLLDLVGFIVAFVIGLTFYGFFASLLIRFFNMPQGFSNAIGFFIAAFFAKILLVFILKKITRTVSLYIKTAFESASIKYLYGLLGVIPGILSGVILVAFILTMIIALPLSPFLKKATTESLIGSEMVAKTQGFSKDINGIFGGAVNDALSFITIQPKSEETVSLNFKIEGKINKEAEQKMFTVVNNEREKRKLNKLLLDDSLVDVGRKHCKDVLKRGYFSHYTLEKFSPFDRMAQDDIAYVYAGENLALAPNTKLAMDGLMKSKGHRENILSENFGTIGIGAIDGGIYGIMFCQEFTD
ncbi:CvpA family protein [Patescibacteria group bacterium]|nr:CvpA family protein [Patescibacteria group bacterium]